MPVSPTSWNSLPDSVKDRTPAFHHLLPHVTSTTSSTLPASTLSTVDVFYALYKLTAVLCHIVISEIHLDSFHKDDGSKRRPDMKLMT